VTEARAHTPYASAASDTAPSMVIGMAIGTNKPNRNHDAQAPEDLTRIGFGYGAAVRLSPSRHLQPSSPKLHTPTITALRT
jgi:hypothetical protein